MHDEATCALCNQAKLIRELAEKLPEYRQRLNDLYNKLAAAETEAVFWRERYEGLWGTQTIEDETRQQAVRIQNIQKRIAEETSQCT